MKRADRIREYVSIYDAANLASMLVEIEDALAATRLLQKVAEDSEILALRNNEIMRAAIAQVSGTLRHLGGCSRMACVPTCPNEIIKAALKGSS